MTLWHHLVAIIKIMQTGSHEFELYGLHYSFRYVLSPGQMDRQVVASGHKLNLCRGLRWVAKPTRNYTQIAKKTF